MIGYSSGASRVGSLDSIPGHLSLPPISYHLKPKKIAYLINYSTKQFFSHTYQAEYPAALQVTLA